MGDGMSARNLKYLPQHCPFLKREVWAIVVKQADGSWQIVNCLDKDRICYDQGCAFTIDGGQWPFQDTPRPTSLTPPHGRGSL